MKEMKELKNSRDIEKGMKGGRSEGERQPDADKCIRFATGQWNWN